MKAIVAILLSMIAFGPTAQAADCNPRAQVHQQRAQNINLALELNGRIPTSEEMAFMLCMLPEKEDKQAFEQKVNNTKAAQAAQRAREEAQRRAAIEAHNRPASPQEQAQAQLHCEQTIRGPARDAGMAYCLAAWKANPHARCAAGNLPCGTVNEGLCYNPYAGQRCVNGQTIDVNSSFPPWAEAFLSKGFPLPNGRYVIASASCDQTPPDKVVILQDNTLRAGRTLFNLVNAGGPQSFTAKTTGDGYNGTIGYNWDVTVNDATSFSLSWVMGNIGRYRLCAPTASTRPAETGRQGQQPPEPSPTAEQRPVQAPPPPPQSIPRPPETFACVRTDNPRVTTTLVVDIASNSVKSMNDFAGLGVGVPAQITDATISWRNRVTKNYGGGGFLNFAGSIDRATRKFTFTGDTGSIFIFECR